MYIWLTYPKRQGIIASESKYYKVPLIIQVHTHTQLHLKTVYTMYLLESHQCRTHSCYLLYMALPSVIQCSSHFPRHWKYSLRALTATSHNECRTFLLANANVPTMKNFCVLGCLTWMFSSNTNMSVCICWQNYPLNVHACSSPLMQAAIFAIEELFVSEYERVPVFVSLPLKTFVLE